ncbi:MAG: hypothetical protein EOS20_10940 [Mesorhizobium sp.]|nr:MAG: hypothetical protein EOS20_10940 [Mesorhizobium sp.]
MPAGLKASLPASFAMLTDPGVRHAYNEAFVAAELRKFQPFFDDLDGRSLSDQQREACIRLEDNNLLVASAGAGKSATMVGKVAYVLEKPLYRPDEILLLAFNKSAADELRTRIARQLQVEESALKCRVETFHALGRGIIEDVEGRPPQLANWVDHPAGEARAYPEPCRDRSGIRAIVVRPARGACQGGHPGRGLRHGGRLPSLCVGPSQEGRGHNWLACRRHRQIAAGAEDRQLAVAAFRRIRL